MYTLVISIAMSCGAPSPSHSVGDEPPFPQLDYETGARVSKELGLPLVTFVKAPATPVDGAVVCAEPSLPGFKGGDVVVSRWADGSHWYVATAQSGDAVGGILSPPVRPAIFLRQPSDCPNGQCPIRR